MIPGKIQLLKQCMQNALNAATKHHTHTHTNTHLPHTTHPDKRSSNTATTRVQYITMSSDAHRAMAGRVVEHHARPIGAALRIVDPPHTPGRRKVLR